MEADQTEIECVCSVGRGQTRGWREGAPRGRPEEGRSLGVRVDVVAVLISEAILVMSANLGAQLCGSSHQNRNRIHAVGELQVGSTCKCKIELHRLTTMMLITACFD